MEVIPPEAKRIFLYYCALMLVALVLFLRRGRRRGMVLRLKGSWRDRNMPSMKRRYDEIPKISPDPKDLSHVQPAGERPLNVFFNYNGESWDAYEVLGIPAGSSPDKIEPAYQAALAKIDAGSRPFVEAAYQAILIQWQSYKASGDR